MRLAMLSSFNLSILLLCAGRIGGEVSDGKPRLSRSSPSYRRKMRRYVQEESDGLSSSAFNPLWDEDEERVMAALGGTDADEYGYNDGYSGVSAAEQQRFSDSDWGHLPNTQRPAPTIASGLQ